MPLRPRRFALLAFVLVGVALAEAALLAVWAFRDPERIRRGSAYLRGERLAARLGCFGCHGPGGVKGSLDPTSPTGSVPSWSGGTHMMYVQDEKEIREYILDGMPSRLRESAEEGRKRLDKLTIRMPAYRALVTDAQLQDLVAYYKAVSWFETPPDEAAARGRDTALRLGCFGCHGPEGRGLIINPGSFKGYIPPWDGDDWDDLVKSDAEFDEWVKTGEISRFRRNPLAAHFLDAQQIKMPGYRDILKPGELESLRSLVGWVRSTRKG